MSRRMKKKRFCKSLCGIVFLCLGMAFVSPFRCLGKEAAGQNVYYSNPDTGFQVLVEDEAELLTKKEREQLAQTMRGITLYGNAAFVTTQSNVYTTEEFVRSYYGSRFGTDSGTVFAIDMDNRNIWIHSDGAVYKVVTKAYADTVTDNVYRYASRGDYYSCATEAFLEIDALLKEQKISQPMKYISNGVLAMILALLINFGLVVCFTRLRRPGERELLSGACKRFSYSGLRSDYVRQTRVYSPVSSGSGSHGSGSHGGGGSSGGSGGGGRSGGGGGHSF